MAVEKLSISMPAEVAAAIKAAAEAEGVPVSAWVTRVARERVAATARAAQALAAARELLADVEAEHGPVTADAKQWAAEVLAAAGLVAESVRAAG